MIGFKTWTLITIFIINHALAEDNMCIMEGDCHPVLNCHNRRPPETIKNTGTLDKLKGICADLFNDNEDPKLCCIPSQVDALIANFASPKSMFLRCPSCYENFRKIFCHFVCSPNQDNFLRVVREDDNPGGGNKVIKTIEYHINKDFADGLFESCKDVKFSTVTAVSVQCGIHASDCNSEYWLDFMGTELPDGFSPFKINFRRSNENVTEASRMFHPINPKFKTCSEPAGPDGAACSCLDCEESCKAGTGGSSVLIDKFEPAKPFRIEFDTTLLVSCIFGIVASVIILAAFFVQSRSLQRKESDTKKSTNETQNGNHKLPSVAIESVTCLEKIGTKMEAMLQTAFRKWGVFVAKNPWKIAVVSLCISLALCLGLIKFNVTTDPVDLWVSPTSQARQDMDYFNNHFRPFYRVEQIIITARNEKQYESKVRNPLNGTTWGSVFHPEFQNTVLQMVREIENITAYIDKKPITLNTVCLKPLEPYFTDCLIQSMTMYYDKYKGIIDESGDYLKRYITCIDNTGNEDCFGKYGGPLTPTEAAFGAYEKSSTGKNLYHTANALVINMPVLNNVDKSKNLEAMAWEKEFLLYLEEFNNVNNSILSIAYKAERSIEDELERVSQSDIPTVAASYVIMFVYIAIALGDVNSLSTLMVNTKISLGLVGVMIVLLSVVSSLGVFFYAGIPATLIIVEVIPFLVLAVGVDNIFILVQAFQRDERQENEELADHIGRVVGDVAPSMLLSSVSMSCCFFIGALTDMPAVKIFALYAGVALIINFFLQMTCFLALFTFDTRRQENKRWDVLCCLKSSDKSPKNQKPKPTYLYLAFKNCYTPFLLKTPVRIVVMFAFLIWLCSSIAVIDKIEVGLDQELSMPEDSYMLKYFQYLNDYLTIGPPLYFIITDGFDYSNRTLQKKICGSGGCDENSMLALSQGMQQNSNKTYVALPVYSWLDDYIDYMRTDTCCRFIIKNNENDPAIRCPYTTLDDRSNFCDVCTDQSVPTGKSFDYFLDFFLEDIPGMVCPKAGRAQFVDSIELKNITKDGVSTKVIGATNFMTYHTVLKKSKDFYSALDWSRKISEEMTKNLREGSPNMEVEVKPYSLVHVFFEQYLTIWEDTIQNVGLSIAAIFIVTFLLLGFDFFSALVVVLTITMITINLMGLMYWWDISLNAVSLVNLVVGVGISVEFCSHLTRCFTLSPEPTRIERSAEALGKMGASILSGITLTDCGILVLAFAKSQIFKVYYFRMYVGIIAFGTLHSLIFLPVFLSLFGPPLNRKRMFKHIRLQNQMSRTDLTDQITSTTTSFVTS